MGNSNCENLISFIRKWTNYDLYKDETQKKIYKYTKDWFKNLKFLEKDTIYLSGEISEFIVMLNIQWGSSSLLFEYNLDFSKTYEEVENVENTKEVICIYNSLFGTNYIYDKDIYW